jgi:excisionase family DNA binding protein
MTSTLEIRPGSVDQRDLAILERALAKKRGKTARLTGFDGHRIEIPSDLVDALLLIVQQLKTGHGVSIAALRAEITTAEAAELLNVSRPFVIKLLESGVMPFRKVGTHRRVRLIDVLEYRDRQDAIANAALDEMVRQAEKHGLYDRRACSS